MVSNTVLLEGTFTWSFMVYGADRGLQVGVVHPEHRISSIVCDILSPASERDLKAQDQGFAYTSSACGKCQMFRRSSRDWQAAHWSCRAI